MLHRTTRCNNVQHKTLDFRWRPINDRSMPMNDGAPAAAGDTPQDGGGEFVLFGFPAGLTAIDATGGPVTIRHEDARSPAACRFHLPNDRDFTIPIGYRAVLAYDMDLARHQLVQLVLRQTTSGAE